MSPRDVQRRATPIPQQWNPRQAGQGVPAFPQTSTPERSFQPLFPTPPSSVADRTVALMPPPSTPPSATGLTGTPPPAPRTSGELVPFGTITTFRTQPVDPIPQIQGLTLNVERPGTYAVTMDFNPCPCLRREAREIQRDALQQTTQLFDQFFTRTDLNGSGPSTRRSWP